MSAVGHRGQTHTRMSRATVMPTEPPLLPGFFVHYQDRSSEAAGQCLPVVALQGAVRLSLSSMPALVMLRSSQGDPR